MFTPRGCEAGTPFHRILVGAAADDSPQSTWAIELAARLARATGAELGVVHVYAEPMYSPEAVVPLMDLEASARTAGEVALRRICEQHLPADTRCERLLRGGNAAAQIVEAARAWHADLVVVGAHGRGRISSFLLGSTAESVVRKSPCPVMTVAHEPAGRESHVERAGV